MVIVVVIPKDLKELAYKLVKEGYFDSTADVIRFALQYVKENYSVYLDEVRKKK